MGNVARCLPLLSSIPSLAHHHLAELVKVHGAGAVLVDLLDDAVEVLLRQPRVQLRDDLPQLKEGRLFSIAMRLHTPSLKLL